MQHALLALLLAAFAALANAGIDWQWRVGRATNYGAAGDPWTIHHGSCGYNYLDPTVNKGWDIAAITDVVPQYPGSCGTCYEIRCAPLHLSDGYGAGLDRTHACYDASQTVTVMITDTCPCVYPANAYSNKRWCCGDYFHLDISSWTFEKMADRKWGVIGIEYRQVPCDYCPDASINAVAPSGEQPSGKVQDPPGGWEPSQDKRPYGKMCFKSSLERADGSGSGSSSSSSDGQGKQEQQLQGSSTGGSSSSGGGDSGSSSGSSSGGSSSGGGSSGGGFGGLPDLFKSVGGGSGGLSRISDLFGSGSLVSSWTDMSYKLAGGWAAKGPDGSNAYCGKLQGAGAILFKGGGGGLMGKRSISFDVQAGSDGQLPDVTISLGSSSKGRCRELDMRSLGGQGQSKDGGWRSVSLPLINLAWSTSSWRSNLADFNGCSSSIGAWDVDQLEFKNKWGGEQPLCLANIQAS